jgi:peptide/nickel transport system permease protein
VLRYFIRRLLWAAVLFVAVTAVTYVIFFVIPADPARQLCGQRATPECVSRARHFLGVDRPLPVQYAGFLDRLVVHGSLGRSFTTRQDVNHVVLTAAPVTASLVSAARFSGCSSRSRSASCQRYARARCSTA